MGGGEEGHIYLIVLAMLLKAFTLYFHETLSMHIFLVL